MPETKAPSRRAWYSLGAIISLGNYALAIVALVQADLFMFLLSACVGTFVAVPLVQAWKEHIDG